MIFLLVSGFTFVADLVLNMSKLESELTVVLFYLLSLKSQP
jgi:hypothetical protein